MPKDPFTSPKRYMTQWCQLTNFKIFLKLEHAILWFLKILSLKYLICARLGSHIMHVLVSDMCWAFMGAHFEASKLHWLSLILLPWQSTQDASREAILVIVLTHII